MSKRSAKFMVLAVGTALVGSACATSNVHDVAWGPVEGPMCTVRVESEYGMPVEVGARAGGMRIDLGVVDPETAHEFSVPCAHRAVTVFRVVRPGMGAENRLDAHAQALDPDRITVVLLRSTTALRSPALR
jgi:hypothetical protein